MTGCSIRLTAALAVFSGGKYPRDSFGCPLQRSVQRVQGALPSEGNEAGTGSSRFFFGFPPRLLSHEGENLGTSDAV